MSPPAKALAVQGVSERAIPWDRNGVARRHAPLDYARLYDAEPLGRIETVKAGVPAAALKQLVADLGLPAAQTLAALDLPVSTVNRKAKADEVLSQGEGERVLGLARLVGQVEAMTRGADGAQAFDAPAWTARWLSEPLPALGGARPLDFLDTMEGQGLVSDALSRIQSGAYG